MRVSMLCWQQGRQSKQGNARARTEIIERIVQRRYSGNGNIQRRTGKQEVMIHTQTWQYTCKPMPRKDHNNLC
jgi:hypothetical protein